METELKELLETRARIEQAHTLLGPDWATDLENDTARVACISLEREMYRVLGVLTDLIKERS